MPSFLAACVVENVFIELDHSRYDLERQEILSDHDTAPKERKSVAQVREPWDSEPNEDERRRCGTKSLSHGN